MRGESRAPKIGCMKQPNARKPRRSRRRRVSEQVVQSLAITSQMALLYPPGIDEWMRRELGGEAGIDHDRINGTSGIDRVR